MITPATLRDIPALVTLWTQAGLTRPWNDPRADAEMALGGPNSCILVLRDDAGLSGAVMVGFDGHRGWVYYLAVATAMRRQGIGRRLMGQAEQWLRDRGAPKIQLMVREDNDAALGFYRALGMETQPVVTIGKRLDGKIYGGQKSGGQSVKEEDAA